ncbi:MAG TPA: anti-sigma factor [Chthoniobacterales bacterium]
MIDESKQEEASRYVLGELSPEAAGAFEAELEADQELKRHVWETHEAFALLALAVPPREPPAHRRPVERRAIPLTLPGRRQLGGVVPWALATCLALLCGWQFRQVHRLAGTVSRLRAENNLADLKIAALRAQVNQFGQASAVVVWDARRQRGVIQFRNAPSLRTDQSYQLWVLDPDRKVPVSAGLLVPGRTELAQTAFQPTEKVGGNLKFAVSVERAGGSPEPHGQIVFVGG